MFADPEDPSSLVIFAVDQFAINTSVCRVRDLLHDEVVSVFQHFFGRFELLRVQTHDDDLVDRRAVILSHRTNVETARKRLAPAFDLAVAFAVRTCVALEKRSEVLVAESAVPALDGAENSGLMELLYSKFRLLFGVT